MLLWVEGVVGRGVVGRGTKSLVGRGLWVMVRGDRGGYHGYEG